MRKELNINEVLERFPKERPVLDEAYQKIYDKHFYENRNGLTKASRASSQLEKWCHKKIAETACDGKTLDVGAGSLNQLDFERKRGIYDIVEPYPIYLKSPNINKVDNIYEDISQVPLDHKYDRIISAATFEHITNLPEVIENVGKLLTEDGCLAVSIPNEGRFLWHFGYRNTTGREFRKRYGLDYEVIMRHEHLNTADEIESLLYYYFEDVDEKLFGITKDFAFYRFFLCRKPRNRR